MSCSLPGAVKVVMSDLLSLTTKSYMVATKESMVQINKRVHTKKELVYIPNIVII